VDAAYIDAPQLLARFGGRSHMWLVRLLERDPAFPRPVKIGRLRFFPVAALIAWERKAAAESDAA
jgi:predicted DNA-binding transcriptional regulator AlpA